MTSSLVGSEMCIRDRLRITPNRQQSLHALQLHGVLLSAKDDPQPGNQPVSYTHLTLPTICSV
eukprot:4688522-Prorocentrum_lima.AAC.1